MCVNKFRTVRAATILAWVTAIVAAVVLSLSAIFGWLDAGHPLHIWLMMALVLAIVCLTHHFGRTKEYTEACQLGWPLGLAIMLIVALGILVLCVVRGVHCFDGLTRKIGQSLALLLPTLFLAITMRPWSSLFTTSNKSPSAEVQRWGEPIALLIMLLALFAFGLERREGGASQDLINWVEIPAILIVFVLAELGVSLVAVAKGVQDATEQAAGKAETTAKEAKDAAELLQRAQIQLQRVSEATDDRIRELQSWLESYKHVYDELNKSDRGLPGRAIPEAVGLSHKDYWPRLFIFGRSWVPELVSDQAKGMLGALFQEFVGKSESDGTVRRDSQNIVCVALDSVYAEVSRRWLELAGSNSRSGQVVWAVTTLLPHQFAFPWAFAAKGRTDRVGARRIKALMNFVAQVLNWCNNMNLLEYRRVTVMTGENAGKFLGLSEAEGNQIFDKWYVLDNRLIPNDEYNDRKSQIQLKPVTTPPFEADRFRWPTGQLGGILAYTPTGERQVAVVDVRDNPWTDQPPQEWLTFRDWYCQKMHKSSDGNSAAWWSVLDESAAADELLKPFSLDCGGVEVQVLDLLMIGSKNGRNIDWHAAALSNLGSDRTECTIRVVTGEEALQKLEASVRGFCNNFGAPSNNDDVPGVLAFGTWEKWPDQLWKKKP